MRTVLIVAALTACHKHPSARHTREALRDELRPVALKNCDLQRVGSTNDGGYAMCVNLIAGVQSAYSYGIDQEDNWGCAISKQFGVPIHQYDCFTPVRPVCEGGVFDYHAECVGPKAETREGKPFDSLTAQIAKNGDAGKRLLVKIDIEGAEWDTLLETSDDVLAKIDQMPMELHGVDDPKFVEVVKKLKKTFWLVSLHFNNYACTAAAAPLPAKAFQVLWVNKRLGQVDPAGHAHVPGEPPDAIDQVGASDCQK